MYDTGWTYVWQSVCCWSFIIWNVHVSVWKFIERIYKYTYCAYITYVFSQRIHFYTYIYTHPQDTMQVPTPWKVQLPGCPTALELGVKASSPGAGRLAGFPAKLPKKKETCQALQNTIKENIQVGPHFFGVFYLKKTRRCFDPLWLVSSTVKWWVVGYYVEIVQMPSLFHVEAIPIMHQWFRQKIRKSIATITQWLQGLGNKTPTG